MGRGRGKGKKQSVFATTDYIRSGEDEKLPVRRRGRPQKPVNNNAVEEDYEFEKIQEDAKLLVFNKLAEHQATTENCKKRKRPSEVKETIESFKEENDNGTEAGGADSIKSIGYRQLGNRRKNKPRRAAEVGVECV